MVTHTDDLIKHLCQQGAHSGKAADVNEMVKRGDITPNFDIFRETKQPENNLTEIVWVEVPGFTFEYDPTLGGRQTHVGHKQQVRGGTIKVPHVTLTEQGKRSAERLLAEEAARARELADIARKSEKPYIIWCWVKTHIVAVVSVLGGLATLVATVKLFYP